MSIVSGTDFSEPSLRAARVAALMAARAGATLHLVCSSDRDKTSESNLAQTVNELNRASEQLADTDAKIVVHHKFGPMHHSLIGAAAEARAELIVVGATGHGRSENLGSQADKLAQTSNVPVLVVRNHEPFENWLTKKAPLRILLGTDFTVTSLAAIRWVSTLCAMGPCEVTGAHVYFPPDEYHRLGLTGARSYVETDETVFETLKHELMERLSRLEPECSLKLHIEPHVGRVGARLASLATPSEFDVVVVGSHARNALELLWQGSVSSDVLKRTTISVTCVPSSTILKDERPVVRTVVTATDFSLAGNAAVRLAYGVAPPGSTVHVIHVIPRGDWSPIAPSDVLTRASPQNAEVARKALDQLKELVGPHDGRHRTELHVIESGDPATATSQAAERWNADLVCVGTHGQGPITGAILGSVAQRILSECRRPVLFARRPQV